MIWSEYREFKPEQCKKMVKQIVEDRSRHLELDNAAAKKYANALSKALVFCIGQSFRPRSLMETVSHVVKKVESDMARTDA